MGNRVGGLHGVCKMLRYLGRYESNEWGESKNLRLEKRETWGTHELREGGPVAATGVLV